MANIGLLSVAIAFVWPSICGLITWY